LTTAAVDAKQVDAKQVDAKAVRDREDVDRLNNVLAHLRSIRERVTEQRETLQRIGRR
jgi:hypothetical protein